MFSLLFPPLGAWPNPPPAVCLTPTLGQSLAATMGCQSNLLEGQKEIINQPQNTEKSASLLLTSETASLSGREAIALLCAGVSISSHLHICLASTRFGN